MSVDKDLLEFVSDKLFGRFSLQVKKKDFPEITQTTHKYRHKTIQIYLKCFLADKIPEPETQQHQQQQQMK